MYERKFNIVRKKILNPLIYKVREENKIKVSNIEQLQF